MVSIPEVLTSSSAGHGGDGSKKSKPMDCGAVSSGWTEYDIVSKINAEIVKKLNIKDTSDYSAKTVIQNLLNIVANTNRVTLSKQSSMSQHTNAFNSKARGFEIWIWANATKAQKEFAAEVAKKVSAVLGIPNRGVKYTTSLYVILNSNGIMYLLEWFFIDNKDDRNAWTKNGNKAIQTLLEMLGYKQENVNKPKPQHPQKPRHNVRVYWFDAKSKGLQMVLDYLKKNKLNYKQTKGADGRVMVETFWFVQHSTARKKLTEFYEKNYWNYDIQIERK